jgi:hypothetical protein
MFQGIARTVFRQRRHFLATINDQKVIRFIARKNPYDRNLQLCLCEGRQ